MMKKPNPSLKGGKKPGGKANPFAENGKADMAMDRKAAKKGKLFAENGKADMAIDRKMLKRGK